jgi:ArsR family transcriptional regulator
MTFVTARALASAVNYIRFFRYERYGMDALNLQAELLKAVAHPVRLQILAALRDGEQCVCHLEAALGLRQAYISQQLMSLRKVGLVADRKDGLRVYYRVLDPGVYAVLDVTESMVNRQAQKQGRTLSFSLPRRAKSHPCDCPKCAAPTAPVLAH